MLTGRQRLQRLAARCVALVAAHSGFTTWRRRRRRDQGECGVYILEYHSVTEDPAEPEGEVHSTRFAAHLEWLAQRYRLVSLREATDLLTSGDPLDRDAVVITFDDGYRNNYRVAWPVLLRHGSSGSFFLTTGFLDGGGLWFDIARRSLEVLRNLPAGPRGEVSSFVDGILGLDWQSSLGSAIERIKNLPGSQREELVERLEPISNGRGRAAEPMTWDEVRKLHQEGAELGCHTVTHPILSRIDEPRQQWEIEQSKSRIRDEVGIVCDLFAYPNGSARDFDETTVRILERSGFLAACTTIRGCNSPGQNPLELRRIGIGADPASLLDARLAGLFDDRLRRRLSRERVAA